LTVVLSNADALLVAIPMVGLLFVGVFRLDELFGKSVKTTKRASVRRKMSGWDKDGRPVCADPDEKLKGEIHKSSRVV
jgi:hypothetical protein